MPEVADERGGGETSSESRRIDALGCMPRKVDASGSEESNRFLRVEIDVDVELQVEAPYATKATISTSNCGAQLDWAQPVDVFPQCLVSLGTCPFAGLLAKEPWELHVERQDCFARR
mmetsp:Transcript_10509/g.23655  ORF Transcript_10509/g.23655 Transcript_10509/m.23655 type:complete len:117 (+) Transcript_10509:720-1070(+)